MTANGILIFYSENKSIAFRFNTEGYSGKLSGVGTVFLVPSDRWRIPCSNSF